MVERVEWAKIISLGFIDGIKQVQRQKNILLRIGLVEMPFAFQSFEVLGLSRANATKQDPRRFAI